MFGSGLRKKLAAEGREPIAWRCITHKLDAAAFTSGQHPTGACWGALHAPGPGAQLGCQYERQAAK